MLIEGFWKVVFSAAIPGAGGLVVLENGAIRGGDDQMIYSGSYGIAGPDSNVRSNLTAELDVRSYVKGANSVFNTGSQPFSLKLSGWCDGSTFHLGGPSPTGGPSIAITGAFIAPLDF